MALNTNHLQAMYARRREIEHQRVERTAAVNRYYDHWGKVTTRYQNWTAPEYYKQAEEQLNYVKQQKEKKAKLTERQERLRQLFAKDRQKYEQEQKDLERPRSKRMLASTEILKKIQQKAKEEEALKKKLELEAKLYGRWRHGIDDDKKIFESKSEHEVLAKLNWLDKQIENQLQREQDEKETQERNLRLQQEIARTEQTQKERQQIREQEIREIRALQEKHMEALKERETESEELKQEERRLRFCIRELDKEFELLLETSALMAEPGELSQAYNLNKVKVFIRKRADEFRNQLKTTIEILERVQEYAFHNDKVSELLKKYKDQLDTETFTLSQIDAMYESEAKQNLQVCEESWQNENMTRYNELKKLLQEEERTFKARLEDNLKRQNELIAQRNTHLSSIEASNEKLKQLINEQEESPRGAVENVTEMPSSVRVEAPHELDTIPSGSSLNRGVSPRNQNVLPRQSESQPSLSSSRKSCAKLTNSFTNLNLDVWGDLKSARGGIDSPDLQTSRTMHVVTPNNVERPKFARKRVAWT